MPDTDVFHQEEPRTEALLVALGRADSDRARVPEARCGHERDRDYPENDHVDVHVGNLAASRASESESSRERDVAEAALNAGGTQPTHKRPP